MAPLVWLPILWFVMFGTRLDLLVSAALTLATFIGPLVLIGPPHYAIGDWRRALLYSALALLVAPVVQATARSLVVKTREEQELSARIHGIMQGASLSSLISTDTVGMVTSFSVGAEALLGYDADEIVGHHDASIFHDPDELAAVAEELGIEPGPAGLAVLAVLAHQEAPSRIWTYLHKDGRRLSVRLAVTELRDVTGALIGYLGVAIDATEAVAMQRSLVESESRWRVVMDQLPDTTVLVLDDTRRFTLVSGAGAMRVGLGDVVGQELREVSSNAVVLGELVSGALDGHEGRVELNAIPNGAEHEVVRRSAAGRGGRPCARADHGSRRQPGPGPGARPDRVSRPGRADLHRRAPRDRPARPRRDGGVTQPRSGEHARARRGAGGRQSVDVLGEQLLL